METETQQVSQVSVLSQISQTETFSVWRDILPPLPNRITEQYDPSPPIEEHSRDSEPQIIQWSTNNFVTTRCTNFNSSNSPDQEESISVSLVKKNRSNSNKVAQSSSSPISSDCTEPNLILQIRNSTIHEEIFNALLIAGYHKIVNRLTYLYGILQDSDDPEDPDMDIKSLQNLALFFTKNSALLPPPDIGVDPEGLLQAEWHRSNVIVLMNFLPDEKIVFAATSTLNGQGESEDIQGQGQWDLALNVVRSFLANP